MTHLGLILILILLMPERGWSFDTVTIDEVYAQGGIAVVAGNEHTCVFLEREVACWGLNNTGQLEVPRLRDPQQVSAGGGHTCALDHRTVKCWGDNYYGQSTVPDVGWPLQISAGEYHTCALSDTGVTCWGADTYGQTNVPAMKNPRQVSAGFRHTCALDDEGVKCWGDNSYGQTAVVHLQNPRYLSTGAYHTCALADEGVRCWGFARRGQTYVPPDLDHPLQISAGGLHTCALSSGAVNCWGLSIPRYAVDVPLQNPKQISSGYKHSCAVDSEGVKCWGQDSWGKTKVPEKYAKFLMAGEPVQILLLQLNHLDTSLRRLAEHSYRYRASYYLALASTFDEVTAASDQAVSDLLLSQALVVKLIAPVIRATDSRLFEEKIHQRLFMMESELADVYGISSLQDIPVNTSTLALCFTAVISTLQLSREFLPEEDAAISRVLNELGMLQALFLARPSSYQQTASELSRILQTETQLLAALNEGRRTAAFGEVLILVREYLR